MQICHHTTTETFNRSSYNLEVFFSYTRLVLIILGEILLRRNTESYPAALILYHLEIIFYFQ